MFGFKSDTFSRRLVQRKSIEMCLKIPQ